MKFKPGAVERDNRKNWIHNQLRKNNVAPLSTVEEDTLSTAWRTDIFDGFSGTLNDDAINVFRASKDVEYIVENGAAWLSTATSQNNAPWGLQRLSQQQPLGRSDDSSTNFVYNFDDSAGQGVDIYIIDTGIQADHPEFGGRARFAQTFGNGQPGVDVHGHGTHVAGIAASQTYGVAKNANIIGVKVMSDSGRGDTSNIIAGINFAVGQAFQSNTRRPSIINISIISNQTPALDEAVSNAVSLGIHVIVGAGNDGIDASGFSPARSTSVITVGAININDEKASFSNIGNAVDIFAPGENILSLAPGSSTQVLSGTSMATPFVSGLAAYLMALEGDSTPASMRARIMGLSSQGIIKQMPAGTVNELAWNGAVIPQPPAPVSNINDNAAAIQRQTILNAVDGVVDIIRALSDAANRAGP